MEDEKPRWHKIKTLPLLAPYVAYIGVGIMGGVMVENYRYSRELLVLAGYLLIAVGAIGAALQYRKDNTPQ